MWAFCPRRMWLEWIEGEAGHDTRLVAGRRVPPSNSTGVLPLPGTVHDTTIEGLRLSAAEVVAHIEQVTIRGDLAVPHAPAGTQMLEIAAHARALRASGYTVEQARIGDQRRAITPADDAALSAALVAIRDAISADERPPPLHASTRCLRCPLAPICQPDELARLGGAAPSGVRPVAPPRLVGLPLHVNLQGAVIGIRGDALEVRDQKVVKARSRLAETASVAVYGNVMFTTQALRRLLHRQIPVSFHNQTGWQHGMAQAPSTVGLAARRAQYRRADDPGDTLSIAKRCVRAKLRLQRLIIRRNHPDAPVQQLAALKALRRRVDDAPDLDVLRGLEGDAARRYFGCLDALLRPPGGASDTFAWRGRKRRPPPDLPNALLSFCYALLLKEWTAALHRIGLDPMLGYLHAPRAGKPSLALDLMEEFRPVVADSVVLRLVNTGMIQARHAVQGHGHCALTRKGRNSVLGAWEQRMHAEMTHPVFGYRLSWRRLFEVQGRLFARWLQGEIEEYPELKLR